MSSNLQPSSQSDLSRDVETLQPTQPISDKKNSRRVVFLFLLSFAAVGTQMGLGIGFIPTNVLINFDNYGRDSLFLLEAMWKYLQSNTAVAVVAWLMPILPATYLPLRFTTLPLGISSLVVTVIIIGSFFSPTESSQFIEMLKTVPELGYMWYETITITLVMLIVNPFSPLLLWAGPSVCACLGEIQTKRNSIIFLIIAILGIVFVLPTVYIFINQNGEFFLLGYKTNSIAGKMLSTSFIFIWVRTYHLVCRDTYQTFQQYTNVWKRTVAVLWALLGTALVEVWVSAAFTLHFAYVSFMNLQLERNFEEDLKSFKPTLETYYRKVISCFRKSEE